MVPVYEGMRPEGLKVANESLNLLESCVATVRLFRDNFDSPPMVLQRKLVWNPESILEPIERGKKSVTGRRRISVNVQ